MALHKCKKEPSLTLKSITFYCGVGAESRRCGVSTQPGLKVCTSQVCLQLLVLAGSWEMRLGEREERGKCHIPVTGEIHSRWGIMTASQQDRKWFDEISKTDQTGLELSWAGKRTTKDARGAGLSWPVSNIWMATSVLRTARRDWGGGGSILEDKLTLKKYLFSHKCKNTASTTSVCFPGLLDKSTFIHQVCSDSSSNLTELWEQLNQLFYAATDWNIKLLNSCVKRISL